MKKSLVLFCATGLLPLFGAAAENATGDVIRNGGFENVAKVPKNGNAYLLNKINQDKCDLGAGPLAIYPADWLPGSGSIKVRMAAKSETDETAVFAGEKSLVLEAVENGGHLLVSELAAKPGKYRLAFAWKGTGSATFCCYLYGKDENGKAKFLTTIALQTVAGSAQWQEFDEVFSIGEGADSFGFSICINKGAKIAFDNVSLRPVTE